MIIALLNQKGGVGKTTLSIHIATALALRDLRVLLIDADPQHSSQDWAASRPGESLFPVIGLATKTLHKEIKAHILHYDYIVIDGPPRVTEVARSVILAADLVLIPVQPSPFDIWACREIVELLSEASVIKEDQRSAFVVNRKIVNTAMGRDVAEALAEFGLPVLASAICQRITFAESTVTGSTVLESDPNSVASHEIGALVDEVLKGEF